jgi:hypothetical protein
LKVNDENSRIRIRIQDPDPNPDPDPLVRSIDPRIGIRIHPKMSWIRNTAVYYNAFTVTAEQTPVANPWRPRRHPWSERGTHQVTTPGLPPGLAHKTVKDKSVLK